jgi:hypothetical protein
MVTAEQHAIVVGILDTVTTLQEKCRALERLMSKVRRRTDPDEPLNADANWEQIVARYTPLYQAARAAMVVALAEVPEV